MNLLSIIGIGLITAVICILLRQARPEYAPLLSLAAGAFVLLTLLPDIFEIVARIQGIAQKTSMPGEYAGTLLKALGICFITQIACDTCKDAGETAISAKIEIAGKIAVLIVSLPLFEQILNVVYGLISAA